MENFTREIPPLHNKDGKVDDEDIARVMAEYEDTYHQKDGSQGYLSAEEARARFSDMSDAEYQQMIDEESEHNGKVELALKHLPILIEKIRTTLSPEDLDMLRKAAFNYKSKRRSNHPFEEILSEIIKE